MLSAIGYERGGAPPLVCPSLNGALDTFGKVEDALVLFMIAGMENLLALGHDVPYARTRTFISCLSLNGAIRGGSFARGILASEAHALQSRYYAG